MTAQESLLPCPFCGGEASIEYEFHTFHGSEIRCQNCSSASGHYEDDKDSAKAIAAWNRRQPVSRTPLSDEAEQAAMFRWLRDYYHGFEHYRSDFAKKQNLFENDIRKQMGITREKQG